MSLCGLSSKELIQKCSSSVFIERNIVGREIVYQLKEPYKIKKLIILYEDSLLDGISREVFESIRNPHSDLYTGKIQKIITLDKSMDRLFEKLFDIFPPMYYI